MTDRDPADIHEAIQRLEAMVAALRKDVVDTERLIEWGRKRWGDKAADKMLAEARPELDTVRAGLFDTEVALSRLRRIARDGEETS